MAELLERRVESLITPTIESLGYDLVRLRLFGQHRLRLQVMIERRDGAAVDVDDCADVSRAISAVLDVDDPIEGSYTLEVSSPGIDRPLVRLADFERFAGFAAKVELDAPFEGRRRYSGRLAGVDGSAVKLATESGDVTLPFDRIAKAKLLLTDDLLAAHADTVKEATPQR